jgi:hypothetical protein
MIMLMYGNGLIMKDILEIPQTKVYNFSSLREGFPRLNLMPPRTLGANTEYEFDVKYMQYIIGNDIVFMNFMTIILDLYNGFNVYLLVDEDEYWSNMLVDSLMKLIQQRYGINGVCVNCLEDFQYAKEDYFADYGILNLDQDKERYTYLDQQYKMMGADSK